MHNSIKKSVHYLSKSEYFITATYTVVLCGPVCPPPAWQTYEISRK